MPHMSFGVEVFSIILLPMGLHSPKSGTGTINVWNNLSTDCVHASNVNNVQEQNRQVSS